MSPAFLVIQTRKGLSWIFWSHLSLCLFVSVRGAESLQSVESRLNRAIAPRGASPDRIRQTPVQVESDTRAQAVATQVRSTLASLRSQARSVPQSSATFLPAATPPRTSSILRRANLSIQHWSITPGGFAAPTVASGKPDQRVLEQAAVNFLNSQRGLLGLVAPEDELHLDRFSQDSEGHSHLRFRQTYQDLPVWPSSLLVHFNPAGQLITLDGAYQPTPSMPALAPAVSPEAAAQRAKARFPAAWIATHTRPELIVFAPVEQSPRLGWKFDIEVGLSRAWRVVVDAQDGRLLHRSTRVFDANVAGSGIDLTGTSRALNVWQQGNSYYLADTSKPMFAPGSNPVTNPKGVISVNDARGLPVDQLGMSDVFDITSSSPSLWNLPAGISAAFNFSQTYDYFQERHGRKSLDNQGGNILAIVRVGNYDNASWHGNLGLMLFGDVRPYVASLDVVGHELSHGVTEKTAGLIYELQSGALNEAFSDIFGEMVEARTRGANDWRVGSELSQPIRNMKNPGSLIIGGLNRPYPSKMSEFLQLPNTDDADHGGVHLNSSIINHCFYQLAEGLPNAIGRLDAERIFYRTLTEYLQAQSQFVDCRMGAIAAAEAIFGKDSAQARATAIAFDTVEIFAAPTTPDPTPIPVVQGPDSTLFVYEQLFGYGLGRHETAQGDPTGGVVMASGIKASRPAISGDGALALYVNDAHDLCILSTRDADSRKCLGFEGIVHSVALSPDSKFLAFVLRDARTGDPEGRITVANLEQDTNRTFTLVAPAIDGVAVDQVLYADAMSFSTDSQELFYDAVSRVKFSGGRSVERWSLYALDLTTARTEIIVPPIDGIDTGNPAPGRAGTRFLAFDAKVEDTGRDGVVVLDRFTGEAKVVAVVEKGYGIPSFTGDERAVVFSGPDGGFFGSGTSLFSQGLDSSRLLPEGPTTLWQEDVLLGVTYRRGDFHGTNALPAVSLSASPAGTAPAVVSLGATASDRDGSIVRVEFYSGATKLGETTTASAGGYRFSWNGVQAGTYRLIARAYDNLGGASDSTPVELTVSPSGGGTQPGTFSIQQLPNGALRLSLQGPAGRYIVSQSSNLKDWTDIYPLVIDASGTGRIEDSGGPKNFGTLFYRVRAQ